MPLIRTIQVDTHTKLGVWQIGESESFFLNRVQIESEIHHPHKRLQHLAGRYLLTELFADFPVSQIQVAPSRKPFLPGNPYYFSISHCGDYAAVIASAHRPVGIDIEAVQDKIGKVASKFLNATEATMLDPTHTLAHQTICWSAKEAIFKWYGLGQLDFRKHMQLHPFPYQPTGMIRCDFLKEDTAASLNLMYIIDQNLCLVWVIEVQN
jgi:4'-phosphopantetheinyl transferase